MESYSGLQVEGKQAVVRIGHLPERTIQAGLGDVAVKVLTSRYVGWANYYSLTCYPSQLKKIEVHIRRRLRSRLVSQEKRKRHLYRKLVKRDVPRKQAAKAVFSDNKRWALSNARAVTRAYRVSWFTNLKGQAIRSDRQLVHWFEVSQWICLT